MLGLQVEQAPQGTRWLPEFSWRASKIKAL
jgi:hypothetical protein